MKKRQLNHTRASYLQTYNLSQGSRQHPLLVLNRVMDQWMLAATLAQWLRRTGYRSGGCWLWSGSAAIFSFPCSLYHVYFSSLSFIIIIQVHHVPGTLGLPVALYKSCGQIVWQTCRRITSNVRVTINC